MWGGESVRAADILEGRVLFWDSDEQAHDCDALALRRRSSQHSSGTEESESESESEERSGSGEEGSEGRERRSRRRRGKSARTPCGPRQGVFVPSGETRQAVIGEGKTGGAVPSPHPRFKGRGRGAKKRFSAVSYFSVFLGLGLGVIPVPCFYFLLFCWLLWEGLWMGCLVLFLLCPFRDVGILSIF